MADLDPAVPSEICPLIFFSCIQLEQYGIQGKKHLQIADFDPAVPSEIYPLIFLPVSNWNSIQIQSPCLGG